MGLNEVCAQIEHDFPEHLSKAQAWIRQPSISATGLGIAATVTKLAIELQALGASVEVAETPGFPVIIGDLNVGAPVTVLLYGMYDVQPVDGEEWSSPPFGAAIRDLPGLGPCIVGRGARNQKGPLAAMLNVIQAFQAAGKTLPVNLKFLIEGEEELGSRHLPTVIQDRRHQLEADAAFFPVFSQEADGKTLLHLGVKGLIYLELIARGGQSGGPRNHMIHSRNAVWISNPAWRLIHALSALCSADGHVKIPGFYDKARQPQTDDEALLAKLGADFDPGSVLAELDSDRFLVDIPSTDLIRRYCFTPTLNIDGLMGGFMGEGTKTVIPNVVKAKLDFRLVKDMSPREVLDGLRSYLNNLGYEDIEIKVHSAYPAAKTDLNEAGVKALRRACTLGDREPEVWPTLAGSAPFYLFEDLLDMPFVMGGLGHAARSHSPDEYCTVEGLKHMEQSIARFLYFYREETAAQ